MYVFTPNQVDVDDDDDDDDDDYYYYYLSKRTVQNISICGFFISF